MNRTSNANHFAPRAARGRRRHAAKQPGSHGQPTSHGRRDDELADLYREFRRNKSVDL